MRPTAFMEYKTQEMSKSHQSETDRLRELLKETMAELDKTKKDMGWLSAINMSLGDRNKELVKELHAIRGGVGPVDNLTEK